ncbi:ABC transporter ATP-binding protein [Candidatus Woesearchaeota archaeon]|nr:ABC transporter ATP-binding protein [Candidatus Woesearchaeota archaeon]
MKFLVSLYLSGEQTNIITPFFGTSSIFFLALSSITFLFILKLKSISIQNFLFSKDPWSFVSQSIIKIEEAWKTYKLDLVEVHAVQGINIDIKKGEFVSIVGKSGSGKSTTLNLIGCLDIPTKGAIYLDGHNIAHLKEDELARIRGKKIGFIFQTFNLIPSLNIVENVSMPMIFQDNITEEKRERKAKELLEMVGLGHRLQHKPSELSGGERQRVAIARSLANDPEVILADEPTGNLDTKTGEQILKMLSDLNRSQGKTLIIVTHDLYVAKQADRIIKLQDGKVI